MRRKPKYMSKLEKIKERDERLKERWQKVTEHKRSKLRFATLERVSTVASLEVENVGIVPAANQHIPHL